ncbi:MAG: phosphomannomutase/phosphoglucomutase [Candidatus Wildermuthbacteria bacterium]|nr:phosphomannomutase/phosphoglucomutase [Candidatus Wildermuthbacteria bacterium]
MDINPSIFHPYDIRGKYPEEINEDAAYRLGRGFVNFLRKNDESRILTIVAGRDSRLSSPLLFASFASGVTDEGCDVVDIGLVPTPMLYYAVRTFSYDGGAMVTASHNPNPYNGFKFAGGEGISLSENSGLALLKKYTLSYPFLPGGAMVADHVGRAPKGKVIKKNLERVYVQSTFELANVKPKELKGIRVAVDAAHGSGGAVVMQILEKAGAEIISLCMKPDGHFPHHVPDPVARGNLDDIVAFIKDAKPVMGVALDGDADRIVFLDERGETVPADIVTALFAEMLLTQRKGGRKKIKILYDFRSSNVVPEIIARNGGVPVPYRVGHSYIQRKMKKDRILFGGELVGHYYWGDGLYYEVPFVVMLKLMRLLHESKVPLSELVAPLQKYFHSGEINFKTQNWERISGRLEKKYAQGKKNAKDGLRVDFRDWWFLVRPSNTEPLIRLVVEAHSKEKMEKKKKELSSLISSLV